jgi:hypothetical protein
MNMKVAPKRVDVLVAAGVVALAICCGTALHFDGAELIIQGPGVKIHAHFWSRQRRELD